MSRGETGMLTTLKRYFISGVLVVVPLIATFLVLRFLFDAVDSVMQPVATWLVGQTVPGLGIVTSLLVILIAGILSRNVLGHAAHRFVDRILSRVPLVRPIYIAAKQLLEAFTISPNKTFQEVVIVEYPRRGLWQLGFVTRRFSVANPEPETRVAVFIPSTPTPVSGMIILVPDTECKVLAMTVEEGIKFIVSGGVAAPDTLATREALKDIPPLPQHELQDEAR